MSWFDPNGKSVAKRAQKVVSDMHTQIDRQNHQIKELEQTIADLQILSTLPIEQEIQRLEKRKVDLERELNNVDEMIATYKKSLVDVNLKVSKVMKRERGLSSTSKVGDGTTASPKKLADDIGIGAVHSAHLDSTRSSHDDNFHRVIGQLSNHTYADDDEHEILETIRLIEPNLLFVLYRSNCEDVLVYHPSEDQNLVLVYRLKDHTNSNSKEALSSFENMMAYGPKVTPNHDRDDAEMQEIPYPFVADGGMHTGELVNAIELPIATDLVIDVWKTSFGRYWATTTIQGTKYAVIESMYITNEVRWGFTAVVSVELTGRHPIDGRRVVETILLE
jgi:hypothetical protein